MQLIETKNAPIPRGHYSQAVSANGFVFVSGILPIVPESDRQIPEGIAAQTEQVLENIKAILQEANSSLNNLVSVQIFISNIEHWKTINEIFAKALGNHKPARAIIPCSPLHFGALIEANAVATANK